MPERARQDALGLRLLRASLLAALLVSSAVCVWVAVRRVAWERANEGFVAVAPADGAPLSRLAGAGIGAIAVRASALAAGAAPSPDAVRAAGLEVALVLDGAFPERIASEGRFALVLVERPLPADDPLLSHVLADGATLVLQEFTSGTVERALWGRGQRRLARGHAVPEEDLVRDSAEVLAARFRRAAAERGVRVLLLSPLPGRSPDETLAFYARTVTRVREAGLEPGPLAAPPHDVPLWARTLLHLGAAAWAGLLLVRFLPAGIVALLVAAGSVALPLTVGPVLLAQADALLVALAAPVLGALILAPTRSAGIRAGVRRVLGFSLFSLAAGLLMAALLSGPAFVLGIAPFRGVKAALLLPPVLGTGLVLLTERRTLRKALRNLRPAHAALALLGIAAGALALLRSGDFDPLVSGLEERARGWLENVLVARPRFKEFLVGHPALLLLAADGMGSLWGGLLLFLGLVGQASILNTFAHPHTPLLLSLLRTGNGLLLGLLVGIALHALLHLARRRLVRPRWPVV